MPAVATSLSNASSEVSIYSQVFYSLDYVPFVSSVKGLTDLFFINCWEPSEPAELSSFSFAYYEHLKDKSDFRYLAIVPILGNLLLVVCDSYDTFVSWQRDQSIDSARLGDVDSIRSLLAGNTQQKAVAIECGCKFENLKYELCSAFIEEESIGKTEIVQVLKRAAENGDAHAYRFLADVLLEYYGTGPDLEREIFEWVLAECANVSSRNHEHAWNTVKTSYDHYRDRDAILPVYLELVKIPSLNINKVTYMAEKLNRVLLDRSVPQAQRTQIHGVFLYLAQLGKPLFMHKVGIFLSTQGDQEQAREWIERAANADYLPSILTMAEAHADSNNFEHAILWYERAVGRDPTVIPIIAHLRIRAANERARGEAERVQRERDAQYQRDAGRRQSEAEENLRRAQREWQAAARRRAEQQRAQEERAERAQRELDAQAPQRQLEQIFGSSFSDNDELGRIYRRWTLRGHPDRGGDRARFQRVGQLMETLRELRGWGR